MNKLIIISGIIATALLLGFLLVWPKYQSLETVNFNVKQKQAELQSKEGYFALVRQASSTLEQYGDPLSKIASALPEDPSLSPLLNFFQSIAAQTGLLLEKINLGGVAASPEKSNTPKESSAAVQLRGSYQSLKNFITNLENSARLIEIEKLSFEVPDDEESSPTIKIDVKVYSY